MRADSHYRQVLDLSQRMLAAGMAQRWDELVALEEERRALLSLEPDEAAGVVAAADKALIGEIQVCDAQLSEKLDAWMSHVRILLRMSPPTAN